MGKGVEHSPRGPGGEIAVKGTGNRHAVPSVPCRPERQDRTRGVRNADEDTALVRFEMSPDIRGALVRKGETPGETGQGANAVHLRSERGTDAFRAVRVTGRCIRTGPCCRSPCQITIATAAPPLRHRCASARGPDRRGSRSSFPARSISVYAPVDLRRSLTGHAVPRSDADRDGLVPDGVPPRPAADVEGAWSVGCSSCGAVRTHLSAAVRSGKPLSRRTYAPGVSST